MAEYKKDPPRWIAGIEPAKELLTATGTQILEIECREQPEQLRQLLRAYAADSTIRAELRKIRELASKKRSCLVYRHGRFLLFFHQRIGTAAVARASRIPGRCRRVAALCVLGVG